MSKSNEQRKIDPLAYEAGQRLKEIRKILGLTGAELGKAVGVTDSTISNIENGRYWPSGEILRYLADEHQVREAYILRGEGAMLAKQSQDPPLSREFLLSLPLLPDPTANEENARIYMEWVEQMERIIERAAERGAEKAVERYRQEKEDEQDKGE